MLRKLLKYEIKATARIFLPLYVVLLSFAIINRSIAAISILEWQAPEVISMIIYISILVGMVVVTFIMMIQRFYKNLLSEEGYLMFTLPTKPWKHITSKLLVSMMWTIASGIAALLSIFIIFSRINTGLFIRAIISFYADFYSFFGTSSILFTLEFLLAGIISLASGVLIIYASIAVGHLFNRHRILASVGAFIALSTLTQILYVIAVFFLNVIRIPQQLYTIQDFRSIQPYIHIVMWLIIISHGLLSSGYFMVTNYILSKRLNLE